MPAPGFSMLGGICGPDNTRLSLTVCRSGLVVSDLGLDAGFRLPRLAPGLHGSGFGSCPELLRGRLVAARKAAHQRRPVMRERKRYPCWALEFTGSCHRAPKTLVPRCACHLRGDGSAPRSWRSGFEHHDSDDDPDQDDHQDRHGDHYDTTNRT